MRPETIIPDIPEAPYPIRSEAKVICGFGRGSAELGIPTANIPMTKSLNSLDTGIYFGWAKVRPDRSRSFFKEKRTDGQEVVFNNGASLISDELEVFPMVMSIGWNPFFNNKEKAAEVHIIHGFKENFYGAFIYYDVLGYIRPELNYTTKEALIADINLDIEIANRALAKKSYQRYKSEV